MGCRVSDVELGLAIVAGLGVSFTLDVTTGPTLVVTFGAVLLAALVFRRRFGVKVTEGGPRGLVVAMFQEPEPSPE